jgi:hypothetical protein
VINHILKRLFSRFSGAAAIAERANVKDLIQRYPTIVLLKRLTLESLTMFEVMSAVDALYL